MQYASPQIAYEFNQTLLSKLKLAIIAGLHAVMTLFLYYNFRQNLEQWGFFLACFYMFLLVPPFIILIVYLFSQIDIKDVSGRFILGFGAVFVDSVGICLFLIFAENTIIVNLFLLFVFISLMQVYQEMEDQLTPMYRRQGKLRIFDLSYE